MLHESKKAAVARGKNLGITVAENKVRACLRVVFV
jgi:hypothetical protein